MQQLNVQQQENTFMTQAALTQASCLQQCGGDSGPVAQRACAITCQENYITALQGQSNLSVQEQQALSQALSQLQVAKQEQAGQTAEATEQVAQTVAQTTQETHQGLKNKIAQASIQLSTCNSGCGSHIPSQIPACIASCESVYQLLIQQAQADAASDYADLGHVVAAVATTNSLPSSAYSVSTNGQSISVQDQNGVYSCKINGITAPCPANVLPASANAALVANVVNTAVASSGASASSSSSSSSGGMSISNVNGTRPACVG